MIPGSLRHRIVVVFVGLFTLVMAVLLTLVTRTNTRIVADQVENDLTSGALLFSRLVEQNQSQLETIATVLTGDRSFREAIVTRDRTRIGEIVRDHSRRIDAQLVMVMHPDGRLIADARGGGAPVGEFPFPELLTAANTVGMETGFRQTSEGQVLQVAVVPVDAPDRIAWVATGFAVDDAWIRDLAGMTGLDVSVVRQDPGGVTVRLSSFDETERSLLARALEGVPRDMPGALRIGGAHYQTLHRPFGPDATVVLLRSIEQANAPFQDLQNALWVIVFAGAVAFVVGSVLLARQIVRPVNQLAHAARRIEAGDYTEPVPRLASDEIGRLAASFDHMRARVASREQEILRIAYEDSLTGLPNRTRFVAEFNQLPAGSRGAVLVFNLDRFAPINNALGHSVGDRLLCEVGRRLGGFASQADLVGRLWGDQFVMLLRTADRERAGEFAHALIGALRQPIVVDGQRLDVDATVGIALFPDDGSDAATLLRRAELAMFTAKRLYRGPTFAADADAEPPHEQLSLIGEMREAHARQEFLLYYQPKLDLVHQRVTGVEALIRWQHPQRGLMAPGSFIPFAERTGFIRELTPWVLDTAAQQAARWREQGIHLVPAVNLSTLDLLSPQLIDRLRGLISTHGLSDRAMCLEITESALMTDPAQALRHLREMAALGFKLSIDDYGVGQASLAYLQTLPVHELKIDASFVRNVAAMPGNAAIVGSTIGLCHALGLSVVGEGAETAEDLAWLGANGCDQAQGYGIARPMPAAELPAWLANYAAQQRDREKSARPVYRS